MDRRTWFSSVLGWVLGWPGWESPIHETDRTLEGDAVGRFLPGVQMVVNSNPVHIYCLEPPQVRLYNIYIKEVCGYLEKRREPLPDERLMCTVECAIDIPEQAVYDFRNDLMSKIGVRHWHGQKSPWDFHPRLKEAIEKLVPQLPTDGLPDVTDYNGFPVRYPHWKWDMELH